MRLRTGESTWLLSTAFLVGVGLAACAQSATSGGGSGLDDTELTQTDTSTDIAEGGGPSSGPPMLDTSPVVLAPTPPPPLSGGTMLLASDGQTAVAADPDRDTVWWANLTQTSPPVRSVALQAGDEPGRVVQDAAGLVHVALRRGGALATVDLANGAVVRRTAVCPAPRGLAYDASRDAVIVACVGGELVTLAAKDDTVLGSQQLDSDLRDPVVLANGFLAVSKLRNAEVLLIDPTGVIASRTRPIGLNADATSAWRMVALAGGTTVGLAHQFATTTPVDVSEPNGYSQGGDTSIVTSAYTEMTFDLSSPEAPPAMGSNQVPGGLDVDVAIASDGTQLFASYAGQGVIGTANMQTAVAVTSVVAGPGDVPFAFVREPPSFLILSGAQPKLVALPGKSVADTGHSLFHVQARPGAGLACASCHPEGRDDGRVWSFVGFGSRRTPSLVGGLLATAPFHWDGALPDVHSLMTEVYTNRMGGRLEDAPHAAAVARFLDAIPRVPASPVPAGLTASVQNGQQLFESTTLGCTACHSGAHLTNNTTVDVGTGQAFQVPTLVGVGLRAPYLHDGCATALADRFGVCGGGDMHGHTSQLSPSDITDLTNFLGTL
jgi:cytochrome c553